MDWFDNNDSSYYPDASTRPTVLLLPGLTGTSKESYILHMIHQSETLGYRYCCFFIAVHFAASGRIQYQYVYVSDAFLRQMRSEHSSLCKKVLLVMIIIVELYNRQYIWKGCFNIYRCAPEIAVNAN